MAKTANLYARIEPDVKEQAENILASLGIPASNAINMFYKQIILHNGIPFELKLPSSQIQSVSVLNEEQLSAELDKGYADMLDDNTNTVSKVFENIRKDYNI